MMLTLPEASSRGDPMNIFILYMYFTGSAEEVRCALPNGFTLALHSTFNYTRDNGWSQI